MPGWEQGWAGSWLQPLYGGGSWEAKTGALFALSLWGIAYSSPVHLSLRCKAFASGQSPPTTQGALESGVHV